MDQVARDERGSRTERVSRVKLRRRNSLVVDGALGRMVGRFLLCVVVLYAVVVWLGGRTDVISALESDTASASAALMNATGVAASSGGHFVRIPGRLLLIGPDCVGVRIAVLVVSAVLAYPVRLGLRLGGAVFAVGVVLAANLVRLVAMAHLAGAPDAVFYLVHDFLFQVGMAAVAVGAWAAWLSYARGHER